MGPYHPALEEPYKLDLICTGETVSDAKLHIGFNFRGIEHLAETRNHIQVIALMERVCGICSNIHTLTLCQAMEGLTGLTPPPRAKYIRVIMAELERLHSHVLWAGIAAKLMGFKTMFMTCFEIREKVMDVLQAISGNRVNYSMNRIGGVNRDIDDPQSILRMIEALEREMLRTIIPIFTTSSTARSRCAGIGILSNEKAISCGVVGPVARASGVPQDLRRACSLCGLRGDGVRRASTAGGRRSRAPVGACSGDHGELQDSSPGASQAAAWGVARRGGQVRLHHRHGHQPR